VVGFLWEVIAYLQLVKLFQELQVSPIVAELRVSEVQRENLSALFKRIVLDFLDRVAGQVQLF
jgi:predicted DNA-binding transcriptional regulator